MDLDLLERTLREVTGDPATQAWLGSLPGELAGIGAWNEKLAGSARKYFLLYTAPLVELLPKDDPLLGNTGSSRLSSLLAIHAILSLYLRVLDDVVDGDVRGVHLTDAVRVAQGLLTEAIRRVYQCGLEWSREAQKVCDQWFRYEGSILQGRALCFDELWQRAATLLVVPEVYASMPEDVVRAYRQYIALLVLVHDLHDVFDDAGSRRRTIPLELFRSAGGLAHFTPATAREVFEGLRPMVDGTLAVLHDFAMARQLRYWPVLLDVISQDFW